MPLTVVFENFRGLSCYDQRSKKFLFQNLSRFRCCCAFAVDASSYLAVPIKANCRSFERVNLRDVNAWIGFCFWYWLSDFIHIWTSCWCFACERTQKLTRVLNLRRSLELTAYNKLKYHLWALQKFADELPGRATHTPSSTTNKTKQIFIFISQ